MQSMPNKQVMLQQPASAIQFNITHYPQYLPINYNE